MDELTTTTPTDDASTNPGKMDGNSDDDNSGNSGGPIDPLDNKPKETDKAPDPLRSVKHKIKSGGSEKELDYDELVKKAELADGAYSKFEESAKAKKEADAILAKIKSGKLEDLLDVVDLESLLNISSQIQETQLKLQGLSQEEIDDIIYRNEAEAAKQELQRIKDEQAQKERSAASQQAFTIIENEISDVLTEAKAQGIPLADLPDIGIQVVDELLGVLELITQAEKEGRRYEGRVPTAKDVFNKIKGQYDARANTYLSKHSPEKLLEMLTPEQRLGLRQASLDKLYGDTPRPGIQNQSQSNVSASQSTPKRMSVNEAFKHLENKFS